MLMRFRRRSLAVSYEVGQLLQHLSEKEKERSHTPIINTHTQKQGTKNLLLKLLLMSDARRCRSEIVCWVSESLCPFEVAEDRGFKSLMKTGRPELYLPSPSTVSRDVRLVFVHTRQ